MEIETKQNLSVYYWLKDLFKDLPIVKVTDGYPEDGLTLPTVAIESGNLTIIPVEIGNRNGQDIRIWFIDVYAKNKTQRDEIGYKILHALEDGIPVYDYGEGFPPTVSPTRLGSLDTSNLRLDVIRVLPELVETLYWRVQLSFEGEYTIF